MTDIEIPKRVLEAAINAANENDPYYVSRTQIKAALIAGLKAWDIVTTGAVEVGPNGGFDGYYLPKIRD